MFRRAPVIFSQCEIDYLKSHKDEPISQLAGYLAKSHNAIKNKLIELETGVKPKTKKTGKKTNIGKRKDLNDLFVRSGWEANILRYLKYKKKKWFYEPKTFSFIEHGIKHGQVSYTPDIMLMEKGKPVWLEVKGYLKPGDQTKIRRFKKFYPEEFAKLKVIVGSPSTKAAKFFEKLGVPVYVYYIDLNKQFKDKISNWE